MFGKRLAQERTRLRLSQRQLAERLNIGRSALGMIEIGHASLEAQRLVDLRRIGVDINYVLTGEPSEVVAGEMLNWELLGKIQLGIRSWSARHSINLTQDKELLVLRILYSRFAREGAINVDRLEEIMMLAA